MLDNFYKATGHKANTNGPLLNTESIPVFNALGASGELVNTKPAKGFRNASGKNKYAMYGADGIDTSATLPVISNPASAPSCIGINIPTALVLALGIAIGYFISKESSSIAAAV
jgi:hypothetical protein